jgi:hypothetical protein
MGRLSPVNVEPPTKTNNYKDLVVNTILDSIKQSNYLAAIEYQKIAQNNWPDEFGKSEEVDFDVILLLICQNRRINYPSNYYLLNHFCPLLTFFSFI